jgi:hypothetical protein
MQQRTTFEPVEGREQAAAQEQASIGQRLWRNQLGIALAAALTFAALVILVVSRHG